MTAVVHLKLDQPRRTRQDCDAQVPCLNRVPTVVAKGVGKRPVAAGRASGGFDFDIKPGDPDHSIMIYRLKSLDPGIAMPELGRGSVHDEGVTLLEQWIKAMPKQ